MGGQRKINNIKSLETTLDLTLTYIFFCQSQPLLKYALNNAINYKKKNRFNNYFGGFCVWGYDCVKSFNDSDKKLL